MRPTKFYIDQLFLHLSLPVIPAFAKRTKIVVLSSSVLTSLMYARVIYGWFVSWLLMGKPVRFGIAMASVQNGCFGFDWGTSVVVSLAKFPNLDYLADVPAGTIMLFDKSSPQEVYFIQRFNIVYNTCGILP